MSRLPVSSLSRREREIMDIIYAKGRASAAEVLEALPDPPGYSAVRALLGILESKGHLEHIKSGSRHYIYLPVQPHQEAAQSALGGVLQTFFGGSVERVVASLLSEADTRLSDEELDRLAKLIDQARKEGQR